MLRRLFFHLPLILMLASCGAVQTANDAAADAYQAIFTRKKKTVKIDINTAQIINPTADGKPLSVVMRFYQLKDAKAFNRALYQELIDNDKAILANDALSADQLVVTANTTTSITLPLSQDAQALGVVAFFREPDDGVWRLVIERKTLIDERTTSLLVSGATLRLQRR